jgi:hypothetical protein
MFPQLGANRVITSGGTFLILTDTMSSKIFLIMENSYSEFVISSSRFLYPIKTETPAFENAKKWRKK